MQCCLPDETWYQAHTLPEAVRAICDWLHGMRVCARLYPVHQTRVLYTCCHALCRGLKRGEKRSRLKPRAVLRFVNQPPNQPQINPDAPGEEKPADAVRGEVEFRNIKFA